MPKAIHYNIEGMNPGALVYQARYQSSRANDFIIRVRGDYQNRVHCF
jgi:hypothetical protein